MGNDNLINRKFMAAIEDRNGWVYVTWSESVEYFGSTKSVKVRGTMNGVAFKTAFMPWGDGTQFLPVSKKMLAAMHALPGDVIQIHLEERL